MYLIPQGNTVGIALLDTKYYGLLLVEVTYKVFVYTGNEAGADTDANVFMTVYGDKGDWGKRQLYRSNNETKFEEGQVCFVYKTWIITVFSTHHSHPHTCLIFNILVLWRTQINTYN